MTNTKPSYRRNCGAVGRVRRSGACPSSIATGASDWRVGILAAFVAIAGTMDVAVAQTTTGASMGSTAETVESSLRAVFETSGVRAAAWCLVKDGRVISQTGFGFADSANARRADAESTVFRAASNGKVFVALNGAAGRSGGSPRPASRCELDSQARQASRELRCPRHARSSPHPYRRVRGPLPRRAGRLARFGRTSG